MVILIFLPIFNRADRLFGGSDNARSIFKLILVSNLSVHSPMGDINTCVRNASGRIRIELPLIRADVTLL